MCGPGARGLSPAPHRQRAVLTVVALFALVALPACYRLTPLDSGTPDAGTAVRLDLTDAGSVRLAPLIGPRIDALEGRAIEVSDSVLVLQVSAAIQRNGVSVPWTHELLRVPLDAVDRIRTRELDRGRTWLVSGAGVVGLFLVSRAIDLGQGDRSIPSRGGDNTAK
jgi:hypothetical protein